MNENEKAQKEEVAPLHIISLGAGVQSSTMALMAAKGEITPMPKAAIFADTQDEPSEVYKWLDWLEKELPFPVIRATKGKLSVLATTIHRAKVSGNTYTQYGIPVFIRNLQGTVGKAQRQCTEKSKLDVIYREETRLRNGGPVIQWIGISMDEVGRMKPARRPWCSNRYPLIELGISRSKCLLWMKRNNFPTPPRSACVYCPYHNNEEWQRLKTHDPDGFAAAVEFEKQYQSALSQTTLMKGIPFLHRSLKPLSEVDFHEPCDDRQLNMFNNECEGMCGV